MHTVIKSEDRGKADHGWLKSYHTFSFADYYNPEWMGFKTLRVINDDVVEPGRGFGTHPHRDMEIVSYVISGHLAHKDSMGNIKTVSAGEVQAMSAGTGVTHSEFNPSSTERVHLLQIWIIPEKTGLTPTYSEWKPDPSKQDSLQLIASNRRDDKSVLINQKAEIYVGKFTKPNKSTIPLTKNGAAWIQVIEGSVTINDNPLTNGDGIGIEQENSINLSNHDPSHFLLFML